MNKNDKELIFNLLKAADGNNLGYQRECFKQMPAFEDDAVPEQTTSTDIEPASETVPAPILDEIAESQNEEVKQENKSSALTISELNNKIIRCTRCGLARTRNNVVPGQGVDHPDVLVIGEGPGYDEDMQGQPFVGKAGALLDKMLAAISLDRKTNCYIANIVKCRPPQNRDPYPQEMDACFSFLEAQINILKPKMILCMGKISSNKLLNTDSPIGRLRGTFYEYNNIPVLVTYHPSALLRNEELKKPAWEDLKQFRAKLDSILGNEVPTNNS